MPICQHEDRWSETQGFLWTPWMVQVATPGRNDVRLRGFQVPVVELGESHNPQGPWQEHFSLKVGDADMNPV